MLAEIETKRPKSKYGDTQYTTNVLLDDVAVICFVIGGWKLGAARVQKDVKTGAAKETKPKIQRNQKFTKESTMVSRT